MPLDPSSPYFGTSIFGTLVLAALVGYAFYTSLAGQPLFRDAILDDAELSGVQ